MSDAPQDPTAPEAPKSMAEQLAEAHVELRPDLEVSRHIFRDEISYIIRDPVTFETQRFSAADYKVLCTLHVDRTLSEVLDTLIADDSLRQEDGERFYQFIFSLHKSGLLKLPVSDESTLYKRHLAKKQAKRAQAFKSILFKQVPLVNPDRFLERTIHLVRPLFSTYAFAAWGVLMAVAGWVLLRSWDEFTEPVLDIFTGPNIPFLWATLIVLKLAHELGHAYACKHYGGHVPEMGAYFIMFTPCAFVDATSSWSFPKKRHRLFVCFAGMYVEIALAAMALLLWSVTPPGFVRSVLHNVIVLGSVVTIGFNINPLMRYDGYFALSDFLEIPNLRSRANAYALAAGKRLVLGLETSKNWGSVKLRVFLLSFGAASAIYKVTLIIGISMIIATKFFTAGLLLGSMYFIGEINGILKKAIPYLWHSEEASTVRKRAIALSVVCLGALPLAIMAIPVPEHVRAPGLIAREIETTVHLESSGFLDEMLVQAGDSIESGDPVARLSDAEAEGSHKNTLAQLEAATIKQRIFAATDISQAAVEKERTRQLEQQTTFSAERLAKLRPNAPATGIVIQAIDHRERGRIVQPGEPLAIIASGARIVRALLTEEDLAACQPKVGQTVEFRSVGLPNQVLHGVISRVTPAGTRELDPLFKEHLDLTHFSLNPATGLTARSHFEIEVTLDAEVPSTLRRGMTGILRLPGATEPFGKKILRKALLFADRLAS